ncbi:hypothetical protein D3C71_631030 [compost metagenome]
MQLHLLGAEVAAVEIQGSDHARRKIASSAEKVHGGGCGPQREPRGAGGAAAVVLGHTAVVRHRYPASIANTTQHYVTARLQRCRGIAQHQHRTAHRTCTVGGEQIGRTLATECAVVLQRHAHATDATGLQQQAAPQVAEGAVEIEVLRCPGGVEAGERGRQLRIQHTPGAQAQIATAGQVQLAITDPSGGTDRGNDRTRVRCGHEPQSIAHRLAHTGVAAGVKREIAATERTEAGETHHPRRAACGGRDVGVGAEVHPPAGRYRRHPGGAAGALPPEPVAHCGTAMQGHVPVGAARLGARGPHVADDVSPGLHAQVATMVRIPRLVARQCSVVAAWHHALAEQSAVPGRRRTRRIEVRITTVAERGGCPCGVDAES